MNSKSKIYTADDQIYCDTCLSYQMTTEIKQIFSMPIELIISFERGINCMNKRMINFPLELNVSQYVEYTYSIKKYYLVGCVNRSDINGKEHYIAFTKDLNSNDWFCSDDDKITKTNQQLALTYGIPLLLFYTSQKNK